MYTYMGLQKINLKKTTHKHKKYDYKIIFNYIVEYSIKILNESKREYNFTTNVDMSCKLENIYPLM